MCKGSYLHRLDISNTYYTKYPVHNILFYMNKIPAPPAPPPPPPHSFSHFSQPSRNAYRI